MTDRYDSDYIDREERELGAGLNGLDVDALDRPSQERQTELRETARKHLRKHATKMNIRIEREELERIKGQA